MTRGLPGNAAQPAAAIRSYQAQLARLLVPIMYRYGLSDHAASWLTKLG
jgi:hypothetical protein